MYTITSEVVPPAAPLPLVKQHLRVTHGTEDHLINTYIAAATQFVESFSGIRLVRRDVEISALGWAARYRLPRPLVSVLSASANGVPQDVGTLETFSDGMLMWPAGTQGLLTLTARIGMVESQDDVSAPIMSVLLVAIGHLYVNREGQPWPPGLMAQIRTIQGVKL